VTDPRSLPVLPHLLVLTDGGQTGERTLLETVRLAIDGGARAVVLREKRSTTAERRALAAAIRPAVAAVGGVLLVASDLTIEADGVHLAAVDPFPADRPALVGRSCHNLADVRRAAAEGCDYATLSPIFETRSKPGYGPGLGLGGLRDIVDDFEMGSDDVPGAAPTGRDGRPMPIYALGGIDIDMAGVCLRAGARGVAVMGGIMRAADPSTTTHALAHAVRDCDCGRTDVVPPRRPLDDTLDVAQYRLRETWHLGEVAP
jgi:thiamine-phosphate diphosphorylase